MKFYNKKLNSLADLKREKEILKYAEKHTKNDAKETFASFNKKTKQTVNNFKGFNFKGTGDGVNWVSTITKLATSKSIVDVAMTLGGPLLGVVGKRSGKTLKRAAVELIGGYLKWKAIEVGINLTKKILKDKKAKTDTIKKRA
ncbi:MAG: hypothetical protein EOP51_12960 [Sphingobacteriales bacterium]|nr:MAG: hypothetical protein EOP51_12960 [Sphingobacteriales bacterium]